MEQRDYITRSTSFHTYSKSNSTLIIENRVSSLSIAGSNNNIIIKAEVSNLVINGLNNVINAQHNRGHLSNVILNGSNNSIKAANTSFNKINNGMNNKLNNTLINGQNFGNSLNVYNNFQNSNINININNRNRNDLNSEISNFINMFTGGNNIQYNQYQNYEYDNDNDNANGEYDDDSQDENEDEDEDEEDEQERMERERQMIQKREEIVLNLNEFQYKHVNKYLLRIEEQCAICFEKFNRLDIVKQFACGEHIFHKKCIAVWLKKSNNCPLCKYDLMKGILKENLDTTKDKKTNK